MTKDTLNKNTTEEKSNRTELFKQELTEKGNKVLYIMLSTMNQMVNFLPLKVFDFKNVLNITTPNAKNVKWDENFKQVVNYTRPLELNSSELLNIEEVKKKIIEELKKSDEEIYFWNITGGQRPIVMAIYDLVGREQDKDLVFLNDKIHYLCYLEGNSEKMKIMMFKHGKQINEKEGERVIGGYNYSIDGLTIEDALRLMGFKNVTQTQENLLNSYDESKLKFYRNFLALVKKDNDFSLRNILSGFNKNVSNKDEQNTERKDNYTTTLKSVSSKTEIPIEELDNQWEKFKLLKAFGYILEEMATYQILDTLNDNKDLKNKVAAVYSSTKINFKRTINRSPTDEFDILLLTKTGQLINFECKSGGMSGDNAKSNTYSTYAVSGVYGLPILISPVLKKEREAIKYFNDSVKESINSAARADLVVWYIDDISTQLTDRLKD